MLLGDFALIGQERYKNVMDYRETTRWSETRVEISIASKSFPFVTSCILHYCLQRRTLVNVLRYSTVHNSIRKINKSMFKTEK